MTILEHLAEQVERMKTRNIFGNAGCVNGEIVNCCDIQCADCDLRKYKLNGDGCENFYKFLLSEYKTQPTITVKEKKFLDFVETGWIARDEGGNLWMYSKKPKKYARVWCGYSNILISETPAKFDFIKWEDEEPWAVEDLRKLEVRE